MNINCFCIVQDLVLNYIIKNYISKTPFLSFVECDLSSDNFLNSSENLDLIIAEINFDTKEKISSILSQFENKYFLLLTDIESFFNPCSNNKVFVLKKNITYSDFIYGLNSLVNNNES